LQFNANLNDIRIDDIVATALDLTLLQSNIINVWNQLPVDRVVFFHS